MVYLAKLSAVISEFRMHASLSSTAPPSFATLPLFSLNYIGCLSDKELPLSCYSSHLKLHQLAPSYLSNRFTMAQTGLIISAAQTLECARPILASNQRKRVLIAHLCSLRQRYQWNNLPADIRSTSIVQIFYRRNLKLIFLIFRSVSKVYFIFSLTSRGVGEGG